MADEATNNRQIRRVVCKLFSWRSGRRSEGLEELLSLPPDDRLAAEEAALAATKWDEKPGFSLILLAALTYPAFLAVFDTHYYFIGYWSTTAALAIATTFLVRARFAWRHQSLASVLSGAVDKRLVPALLAHRHSMGTRSGPKSPGYQAIIAALERLLPMVDEQECLAWKHNARQQLLDFIEGPPVRAAITIQALRLAPAIGDYRTLSYVSRLTEPRDWGGAVAPHMRIPLREAARACRTALWDSLERRKTSSQLLRASDSPPVQTLTELLRAASGSEIAESEELLRAGSSATIVEHSSDAQPESTTVPRSYILSQAPSGAVQQAETVVVITNESVR